MTPAESITRSRYQSAHQQMLLVRAAYRAFHPAVRSVARDFRKRICQKARRLWDARMGQARPL